KNSEACRMCLPSFYRSKIITRNNFRSLSGESLMKTLFLALCIVFALMELNAQTNAWQPSPGHTQIPIWPGTPPSEPPFPGPEYVETSTGLVGGKTVAVVHNVSVPTMTVYSPKGKNTGVAMLVFPGGGYQVLAMDLEGTEICDWLNSRGITAILLK